MSLFGAERLVLPPFNTVNQDACVPRHPCTRIQAQELLPRGAAKVLGLPPEHTDKNLKNFRYLSVKKEK